MKSIASSSCTSINHMRTIAYKWRRLVVSRLTAHKKASAVILMYHSINDPDNPAIVPFNIVSPSKFATQMRCLARRYRVVSLETLVEELRSGQLPVGRTVVLTFDDGYQDSFTLAFPILQQHGLTAIFFLPTGYIGRDKLKWDDSLSLLLTTIPLPELEIQIGGRKTSLPIRNSRDRQELFSILLRHLCTLDVDERERILSQLMARYGSAESVGPRDAMLSWENVKKMAQNGMTFGAHTVNHVSLAALSEGRVVQEIEESKYMIENHIGQPATCFSYPYGKSKDFSPITQTILRAKGFVCAVTSDSGSNIPGSNLLALKRVAAGTEDSLLDWELRLLSE